MVAAVPAQGRAWNQRSFKGELWVLPSPPPGHPPAATLRRCLGRATVPKVFSQKRPGIVQAESAVGIRPVLLWKIPWIHKYLTKPTASLLLQVLSQNPPL